MRKFTKEELDLIYNVLGFDEELLWREKPKLLPNYTVLSTLFAFLVTMVLMTVMVGLNPRYELWFLVSLILIDVGIVLYGFIYTYLYYITNKDLFYIITSKRLIIYDGKQKDIRYEKLFSMIRILRIKRSFFNTASIIFDVEIDDNRMKEIGFINVSNAVKVLKLIKSRISHLKMNE